MAFKENPEQCGNQFTVFQEAENVPVTHYTKGFNPLNKVNINVPGVSLGHTYYIPEKGKFHLAKLELLAKMDSMMKDTSVNKLKFGTDKITNGASSDLKLQKPLLSKNI
ncbi:hypothetical protein QYM36_002263 [Artemia franciscana]|uniref:Peptidase M41 domain-containing protein n=1 Tax=Artemia franciscana TaxID=6661 RepID=A0AA88IB08_ARTSF|nr:hypothetical protein QYM36_002263 [Artemia franciscana]